MMVSDSFYCTLWMLSLFGQYLGEDLQFSGPVYGAVGGSVVFAPVNPPSTSINIVQWHFGSTLILTGSPDSPTIFPAYRDRVSFDINTFALELWNLILGDSGIYRLTVITSVGAQLTGETSLQVFENITNVRVTGPEGSLIEGESSANFSSEGTGIITSVQWMKDNLPLSPSNSIIFSSDNRSVSISPVQRSDSGEYQCTYRNPASSETAKPVRLIINYGPEDVSVKGEDVVDLGVHVSLSCSANSEPAASFSWKFNETDTNVTTDTFTINKTDFTHSGDYICTASNNVTKRNASHKHALLVKERGGGLSSGAIAGIVIGVLVAVAGICGLTVYLTKTKQIPKLNQQQKGQASEAAQSRQETKARGDGAIPGKMSEHIYENDKHENEYENDMYENVKLDYSRRPRVPTPPQVSNPPPVRR
ncbi:carcinoembryonic antigen-related cell adhesion molecule 20-like isoform X21 [Carassius gibelio]|uniref:carcinoembryonic antigen-related cell adhesion molecule 20-like isoform X6 n=1 Tax=Carassius gibelio TaxID=101364 RepID=UPI00227777EB|nr:carcinoembryonic antigen-related cell adhesion molecule 20-like isoform X6 [Carassius gibelio]XP_052474614.1 carcinoembryonic antigen-related cell adhesion molecule 20-like isoform X7 [Carassius gibelio]XP_052474615.1 carcinoembryonic antigen-related cell adhesion molecule 20-like isoform X8 [Carassius gibelio]XP_052474621.1 carcinoembryonic antigen-related cell adhesion molecule 20-like isoform X14 [Carassius gibelio]XP_052474625.1 carcinoembryonic antigen-related cell adhesion molecule 20-